ncbi:MAG: hypothetical protein EXS64_16700 [Candidatus Latescibacteria bacterium]|nr:hypothetical protein [Candidatus Latescibacterota bacterium]
MRTIFSAVVFIVLILISFALVVGIFLGIGWALTRILPFSLFEGTAVGMVAALATWMIWRRIFEGLSNSMQAQEVEEDDEEDESEIPESQFWKTRAERTWENWFRYVFANAIYDELDDSWDGAEDMDERTLREQAIRLADAAVEGLKGKPVYTRRVRISPDVLKHELVKVGQLPYPHKVLKMAADAVSAALIDWEDDVREVIRERSWGELAEID